MLTTQQSREELIAELGIAGLPVPAQDELLSAVGESMLQAVTLAAILQLPQEAQDEFKRLTDTKNGEGIATLLKKHISDPDAFIQAEARKELAAFKETLKKKLAEA